MQGTPPVQLYPSSCTSHLSAALPGFYIQYMSFSGASTQSNQGDVEVLHAFVALSQVGYVVTVMAIWQRRSILLATGCHHPSSIGLFFYFLSLRQHSHFSLRVSQNLPSVGHLIESTGVLPCDRRACPVRRNHRHVCIVLKNGPCRSIPLLR